MSDFFEEEEEQQDDRTVTVKRSQIKELEAMAKAGKKAADRLAELERKEAFRDAGIPTGDKRANYFIKGYEGDLNAEAIKAQWEEDFGSAPPASNTTDPAEAAAHERVSAAASGAEPPKTSITVEDLENAQTPEEVMRLSKELGLISERQ